jgi:hypothetical protein
MGKSKTKVAPRAWSPRSQRSLRLQLDLEGKVKNLRSQISFQQGRLKKAEEDRDRCASKLSFPGMSYYNNLSLDEALGQIGTSEATIKLCEQQIADIETQICELSPNPAQAKERASTQAEMARLADDRFQQDQLIRVAIIKLRELLKGRSEMTDKLQELAAQIDFMGSNFDSERFDELLSHLPNEVLGDSQRWCQWFFGSGGVRTIYRIERDGQSLPETLGCANFFRAGDEPLLTPEERKILDYEPPRPLTSLESEALHYGPKKTELDARDLPGYCILPGTIGH